MEIAGIERAVRKALVLQELALRSPGSGVIVECGVGAGWSLGILTKVSPRVIYAFDSFAGFPIGSNMDSPNFHPDKMPAYKGMGVHFVQGNLERMGVSRDTFGTRLIFKEGFFPQSFTGFDKKISLLHLDVDLYQSYVDSLEFFFPLVEIGGIITFDEYDDQGDLVKWPGAKIAIDEFVQKHNLRLQRHWTNFTFLIKNDSIEQSSNNKKLPQMS